MILEGAFSLRDREVISLVGSGGKTTLMFALGKELSLNRKGIILTTTTKIREPAPSLSSALLLSDKLAKVKEGVEKNWDRYPYLLIAQGKLDSGKLQGIPPEWIGELHFLKEISVIVVEADGAAGRPLKAPREGEPAIPASTSLLVPMVGIDGLGCPLNEQYVFRSAVAARLLHLEVGSRVTEEVIASLLAEIIKTRPAKARVIPFINKVDFPDHLKKARNLASLLLRLPGAQIERVLLGQAQSFPFVRESVSWA